MRSISRYILSATALLLIIMSAFPLKAADESSDKLKIYTAAPLARKLEPDKIQASGEGVGLSTGKELVLQPTIGLSHAIQQQELGSVYDDITHKIHAQAGGRLNLFENLYFGVASKIPVYNYEIAESRTTGGPALHPKTGRHDYELLRISPNNLTWTGEMGLNLGKTLDFNLYYDQNLLKTPSNSGMNKEEEVIGTRFIFRFK